MPVVKTKPHLSFQDVGFMYFNLMFNPEPCLPRRFLKGEGGNREPFFFLGNLFGQQSVTM
jgi:hypothetical protein